MSELIQAPLAPVFRLTGSDSSPALINYDILGLHKRRIFIKGELSETQYYQDYQVQTDTYSGLCVVETNTYLRQMGFVYIRVKLIAWYLTNDQVGEEKTTRKYYALDESMQEGVARRHNLVYQAAARLLFKIGVANTIDLQDNFKAEVVNYERGVEQPLINAIAASDKAYLDFPFSSKQTVREYLISELTISYE